ncbi:uncharacterized protein METZ01_LOCUS109642 [marine metagenome]|uniref:Uncharacterized protein n=1 Tax=marine metagenome TaxID=408172 RepID=A0A381WX02_9ZZZZ
MYKIFSPKLHPNPIQQINNRQDAIPFRRVENESRIYRQGRDLHCNDYWISYGIRCED